MYSVHVFLLRGGELGQSLYMVEFRRGHMDIFEFKDYYKTVYESLNQYIKEDLHLSRFNAVSALPDLGELYPSNPSFARAEELGGGGFF